MMIRRGTPIPTPTPAIAPELKLSLVDVSPVADEVPFEDEVPFADELLIADEVPFADALSVTDADEAVADVLSESGVIELEVT
jgi:hypothetical protein